MFNRIPGELKFSTLVGLFVAPCHTVEFATFIAKDQNYFRDECGDTVANVIERGCNLADYLLSFRKQ